MSISRNFTLIIHFILDQLLPPIIRDNRFFMAMLMSFSLGRNSKWFLNFKSELPDMSPGDIEDYYRKSAGAHIERETDLNAKCVERISNEIVGKTVLDIACGRGFLAKLLSKKYQVTGSDFIIDANTIANNPSINWDVSNIESLDYQDDQFDTVVCAHTLEHVVNIDTAIFELRRVAKKRLIVVLPKQRPYQYTFDLHVHFFSYIWQVRLLFAKTTNSPTPMVEVLGGDWIIIEDYL